MGDAEQMWVAVVPAFDEDEDEDGDGAGTGEGGEAELVVIGIDPTADDPGQWVVNALMDRGHEAEECVFYLLPFDLGMRYERAGDRLGVLLLTSPGAFDEVVPKYGEELVAAAAHLRAAPLVDGGVPLLRREIATGFDPATEEGGQPVVLLVREGPAAGADLFSAFEEGEAALAVVGPWGSDEGGEDD
ncbi:hypothetical protein Q5530_34185 [Saccharothrix sp. BKS2]|uniref:hypothetical protein n=1 Tax=Saccharothrix sp. BKS2 TaxID=3064400 RepID=UPI0039EACCD5